ncbi:MAG: hypothetical protein HN548_03365 [Opitutae bacterium]|jgi:hypothetical protein|nr:hypothetical protein [Opitutae bacterium]
MRSLILIFVYLSKDILKRWLETPGAVFARLLIAISLCLLFLFMQAGFVLTEKAVERKIESFGLNTMILRSTGFSKTEVRPSLDQLLSSLSELGTYLPFSSLYVNAELSSKKRAKVIVYNDHSIPGLNSLMGWDGSQGPIFLAAYGYPKAMVERVKVWKFFFDADVVKPPSILRFISLNDPLLFIPESMAQAFEQFSVQESVLFLSDDSVDLIKIIESTEALLKKEGFDRYELSSPIKWVGELDGVRDLRVKAQAIGGGFVGLLIVLIFGSIAVFEYRQNIFATALFKSFGLHSIHLILRYLIDGLLLLFISFLGAVQLAQLFHGIVFKKAGFAPDLLDVSAFNPYEISGNLYLLILLAIASLVSILPICIALRKPVGKVLG